MKLRIIVWSRGRGDNATISIEEENPKIRDLRCAFPPSLKLCVGSDLAKSNIRSRSESEFKIADPNQPDPTKSSTRSEPILTKSNFWGMISFIWFSSGTLSRNKSQFKNRSIPLYTVEQRGVTWGLCILVKFLKSVSFFFTFFYQNLKGSKWPIKNPFSGRFTRGIQNKNFGSILFQKLMFIAF